MLKEIPLREQRQDAVRQLCSAFADVSGAELGKAALKRCGVRPEDVKELLVGDTSAAPSGQTPRQIGIGAGLRRRRNGNRNGP